MLKRDRINFGGSGQRIIPVIPPAIAVAPKNVALAQNLDDLFGFRRFGHCLSECYGDAEGASWWSKFVSPAEQGPLKNTVNEYYNINDEPLAIRNCSHAISDIILNDADIDAKNLMVIEKGSGSLLAMVSKTLVQLDAFEEAGIKTRLYVTREHSPSYREQAKALFAERRPDIVCVTQDVDYNKDDPSLIPMPENDREKLQGLDYEGPRIILEYGTSRSNIATNNPDAVPYEELYATFAHDRKVCRDGGILIMASDCNQDKASMEGSFSHQAHAEFSKNILRRGLRENVLSDDLNLELVNYSPRWDAQCHLLKHSLLTDRSQSFGLHREGDGFVETHMTAGEEYLYSHSFRWPEKVIQDAARSNGFRPLGTFWAPKDRVAVFVFKAV